MVKAKMSGAWVKAYLKAHPKGFIRAKTLLDAYNSDPVNAGNQVCMSVATHRLKTFAPERMWKKVSSTWVQEFLESQPEGIIRLQTVVDHFNGDPTNDGKTITPTTAYIQLRKYAPERISRKGGGGPPTAKTMRENERRMKIKPEWLGKLVAQQPEGPIKSLVIIDAYATAFPGQSISVATAVKAIRQVAPERVATRGYRKIKGPSHG